MLILALVFYIVSTNLFCTDNTMIIVGLKMKNNLLTINITIEIYQSTFNRFLTNCLEKCSNPLECPNTFFLGNTSFSNENRAIRTLKSNPCCKSLEISLCYYIRCFLFREFMQYLQGIQTCAAQHSVCCLIFYYRRSNVINIF